MSSIEYLSFEIPVSKFVKNYLFLATRFRLRPIQSPEVSYNTISVVVASFRIFSSTVAMFIKITI